MTPLGDIGRRPAARTANADRARPGIVLLICIAALYLVVVLPVVVRGAPLRDDFEVCLNPRFTSGPARLLHELGPELGAVRLLGRFTELSIIGGLCDKVPFGTIILIPLLVTLTTGYLLRGLLHDVGLAHPWPEIGAALWFLQPLGTEAALWPAALHVPVGLALALVALRMYSRGHLAGGAFAGLAASWTLEQVLFALPLAVWVVTRKQRATIVSGIVAVGLLAIFVRWPGLSSRTAVPLSDRLSAIVTDPIWYVKFPAIGTGAVSIPLAVLWAFPISLLILATGALVGARCAPSLLQQTGSRGWRSWERLRFAVLLGSLGVLVSLPAMVTLPHEHGPRVFTPVWLLLAAFAALVGARVVWKRVVLAGMVAGLCAAGALLSLALSVWVRLQTADFTEATSRWIGAHVPDGGRVVVCDVPRTVVSPAPNGPFALHEFHEPWAARAAIEYYTGRRVKVDRTGQYWPENCDDFLPADLVVSFDALRRQAFNEH
jgi:hypothetical protein